MLRQQIHDQGISILELPRLDPSVPAPADTHHFAASKCFARQTKWANSTTRAIRPFHSDGKTILGRLPLHFVGLEPRISDNHVPDHSLESLRVRRDSVVRDRCRDHHGSISNFCSVTAVASNDAGDLGANLLRQFKSLVTMFALIFFSRLPPPTEKTISVSPLRKRLPCSQRE